MFTGKVSQLIRLSREQWSQAGAADLLSESVARAVTNRANQPYIAQAAPISPAVTPPAGLLNVAGIIDGGAIAADLDALADAMATIEAADGMATHIIEAARSRGVPSASSRRPRARQRRCSEPEPLTLSAGCSV